jgi:phytoene dehydrogenase-like protein
MVESLTGLTAARGVELRTCARVVAVEHRGGAANGVRLSGGERIAADAVVMNGNAGALPELLGRSVPPLRERSLSAVVMLLGLGRRLAGLEQHNVFFTADCERELHELFELRRFPADPTVYVKLPTRVDGTLAPKGGECLFAMANAPDDSGGHWDGARTRQAYGRIMSRLEAGGAGVMEPLIEVRDVWTPRRLESAYLAPGGAILGGSSHGWRNAFLRPANVTSGIGGSIAWEEVRIRAAGPHGPALGGYHRTSHLHRFPEMTGSRLQAGRWGRRASATGFAMLWAGGTPTARGSSMPLSAARSCLGPAAMRIPSPGAAGPELE